MAKENKVVTLDAFLKEHNVVVFSFGAKAFEQMGISGDIDNRDARIEVRKKLGVSITHGAGIGVAKKALNEKLKGKSAEQIAKIQELMEQLEISEQKKAKK